MERDRAGHEELRSVIVAFRRGSNLKGDIFHAVKHGVFFQEIPDAVIRMHALRHLLESGLHLLCVQVRPLFFRAFPPERGTALYVSADDEQFVIGCLRAGGEPLECRFGRPCRLVRIHEFVEVPRGDPALAGEPCLCALSDPLSDDFFQFFIIEHILFSFLEPGLFPFLVPKREPIQVLTKKF